MFSCWHQEWGVKVESRQSHCHTKSGAAPRVLISKETTWLATCNLQVHAHAVSPVQLPDTGQSRAQPSQPSQPCPPQPSVSFLQPLPACQAQPSGPLAKSNINLSLRPAVNPTGLNSQLTIQLFRNVQYSTTSHETDPPKWPLLLELILFTGEILFDAGQRLMNLQKVPHLKIK